MTDEPTALITGATQGLGRALADELHARGWSLVLDGRDPDRLDRLRAELPSAVVVAGDVTDPQHRAELWSALDGRLDLLVLNASTLGASPLPTVDRLATSVLRATLETNVVAPLALVRQSLPALRTVGGVVAGVTSDAAVEAYAGWAGYGASKAALEQLLAVLAVEEAGLRVYAIDPGDLRTQMHQDAFPGEDISDRPTPAEVVPSIVGLLDARPPSGRYRAADWAADRAGVR